ncbi:hypothetical protein K2173_003724 [Erythroxylum novogranatense]|uniref:Peptidase A1 domain-containing protein n=1 Tax=Erythroxylum novogranatense TaxID=1862640 RepID=A0AAV8TAT6_9ROSI|nr:hypothetical protein K2173_003724 [Erythroxylum novogranatense]
MAHSLNLFFLLCSLLFLISPSIAKTSSRPKALVLPVTKDSSSLQYITTINQRTPLVPVKLTVDLGGRFLWVDCEYDYVSSSFLPAHCKSVQCSLAGSKSCINFCYSTPKPLCHNNTCENVPYNSVSQDGTTGDVSMDVLSIPSTDGKNPGKEVSVPKFLFTCVGAFLKKGLASGVKGIAALGRTKISLPNQLSAAFSFRHKFAICLSSTPTSKGVIFFGDGPYMMLPNIDVSTSLIYTPLVLNPVSALGPVFHEEPSADYFIKVTSIRVNGKIVRFNTSLLSIDKEGNGGTSLSTVTPYTVMETSIYKAVVTAFVKEISGIPRVAAVSPFGACFDSQKIGSTRVGPAVPPIDLVLQSESVYWRIFGANSMVQVSDKVICLGLVDGGETPKTSIVIGGHQLEDNLLQFDLASSKLGFSSSLLFRQTTCSNFNFTLVSNK